MLSNHLFTPYSLHLLLTGVFMHPQWFSWPEIILPLHDFVLWFLREFLDLNILSQLWQGKESPSKWTSTCSFAWERNLDTWLHIKHCHFLVPSTLDRFSMIFSSSSSTVWNSSELILMCSLEPIRLIFLTLSTFSVSGCILFEYFKSIEWGSSAQFRI